MKKLDSKKTNGKIAAEKEQAGNEIYNIPDEASCSAEFPDGCIFSDEN